MRTAGVVYCGWGAQIAAVGGFQGSDEMQWSSTYEEKSWYRGREYAKA
jgi:hypothetical protein